MEDFDASNSAVEQQELSSIQKSAIGWGIAALVLAIIMVSYNNSAMVLGAGVMAKIFAAIVGTVTGTIGALIGDAIRRFAKPDMMFTSGGMGSLIWIKLFWMMGPQTVGLVIGRSPGHQPGADVRKRYESTHQHCPISLLPSFYGVLRRPHEQGQRRVPRRMHAKRPYRDVPLRLQ